MRQREAAKLDQAIDDLVVHGTPGMFYLVTHATPTDKSLIPVTTFAARFDRPSPNFLGRLKQLKTFDADITEWEIVALHPVARS